MASGFDTEFRIGFVSSIAGLIAATLFAATVSIPNNFRKILVSVKCLSAMLGPGNGCANFMDAWKMRSFCRKNPCPKTIPRFGFFLGGGGGGEVPILFLWARRFADNYWMKP